jgi:hypothetical protein
MTQYNQDTSPPGIAAPVSAELPGSHAAERARRYRVRQAKRIMVVQVEVSHELLKRIAQRSGRALADLDRDWVSRVVARLAQRGMKAVEGDES